MESKLLSTFWGQPVYLRATVLLPRGYDTHRAGRYPVIYEQGHFGLEPPLGCSPERTPLPPGLATLLKRYNLETGHEFAQRWSGPSFPRMIAVTFQASHAVLRRLVRSELGEQRPVRGRDPHGAHPLPRDPFPDDSQVVRAGADRRLD